MRDPKRIDEFCSQLAEIWKNCASDWRYGQLMINFLGSFDRDPFFYEEDEMLKKLREYFNLDENNQYKKVK